MSDTSDSVVVDLCQERQRCCFFRCCFKCLFGIGYFFYARTLIGYWATRKVIARAKKQGSHSDTIPFQYNDLLIMPVAMMLNNYAYIIFEQTTEDVVVIDPGEPETVIDVLECMNFTPRAILTTHRHWDHSGGNLAMKRRYPNIKVFGSRLDKVPGITNPVQDGEILEFGKLKFTAIHTPGHTRGHMVYCLDGLPWEAPDSLFTGDLLYRAIIGAAYEGTELTLLESLDKIMLLNEDTLIWPGHETSPDIVLWASCLQPNNSFAWGTFMWLRQRKQNRLSTCPSSLHDERLYNPFLRTTDEGFLRGLGLVTGEVFTPPDLQKRVAVLELLKRLRICRHKCNCHNEGDDAVMSINRGDNNVNRRNNLMDEAHYKHAFESSDV